MRWAGKEVADRVIFTDVANKNDHIHRGRIADLFLDTTEVCCAPPAQRFELTGFSRSVTRTRPPPTSSGPARPSSPSLGMRTRCAPELPHRSPWPPALDRR